MHERSQKSHVLDTGTFRTNDKPFLQPLHFRKKLVSCKGVLYIKSSTGSGKLRVANTILVEDCESFAILSRCMSWYALRLVANSYSKDDACSRIVITANPFVITDLRRLLLKLFSKCNRGIILKVFLQKLTPASEAKSVTWIKWTFPYRDSMAKPTTSHG